MNELLAFLRARLDEDERVALATPGLGKWEVEGLHVVDPAAPKSLGPVASFAVGGAAHVARHDPARVLREVQAKRAILDEHGDPPNCSVCHSSGWDFDPQLWPCDTLRALAAVYSDHPDYGPTWGMSGLVAFLRDRWGSKSGIRVQAQTVLQAFGEAYADALIGRPVPVPIGSHVKEFPIREYLAREDAFVITSPG